MADHQVITNEGLALVMSCLDQGHELEFVSYVMGNGTYTAEEKADEALKELTELKSVKQQFQFASSERTGSQILLMVRATNDGLAEGYYMAEYGVYAQDKDAENPVPVLYEVGVEDNPSYMPDEDLAPTVVNIECYTVVSNSSQVVIRIDPYAYALQSDVDELDQRVTALENGGCECAIATAEEVQEVVDTIRQECEEEQGDVRDGIATDEEVDDVIANLDDL